MKCRKIPIITHFINFTPKFFINHYKYNHLTIDNISLGEYPLFLAPMEDITDPSFRMVCKMQWR